MSKRAFFLGLSLLGLLLGALWAAGRAVQAAGGEEQTITRVSQPAAGIESNNRSARSHLSADGHWVVFYSFASNLVPSDTNDTADIFLHERATGALTRVSLAADGDEANGGSFDSSLSGDGRWVAFSSAASNLVPGDSNASLDVFLRDQQTSDLLQLSRSITGTAPAGDSYNPHISADGRFVAYSSDAPRLVPDDDNAWSDIFVYDREAGTTVRASRTSGGVAGNHDSVEPVLSGDGRFVAFRSYASNLVPDDTNVCMSSQGVPTCPDIFVHDLQTGETVRVSVSSDGAQANNHSYHLDLSADGRYVAFASIATNLVPNDSNQEPDVFLYDRATGELEIVSLGLGGAQSNDDLYNPALSADGRFVAFESIASNLVAGDTARCDGIGGSHNCSDIFIRDRLTGETTRASLAHDGSEGDGDSVEPALSGDGRYVAFGSEATTLVPGDANAWSDVFLRDRGPQAVTPTATPTVTATPPASPTVTPGLARLLLPLLRR